jgi:hypothetical protein
MDQEWAKALALMGSCGLGLLTVYYSTNIWGWNWEKLKEKFRAKGVS